MFVNEDFSNLTYNSILSFLIHLIKCKHFKRVKDIVTVEHRSKLTLPLRIGFAGV